MSDALSRRLIDPPLAALAARLVSFGIGADAITVAGFVSGLSAIAAIAYGHTLSGLALFALNRVFDALDGAMARATGPTRLGGVLDSTLGAIVLTGLPLGFALADPSRALAAVFLACALAGALSARIASPTRPARAVLVEDSVAFLGVALACILPDRFSIVAYVLGVLAFAAAGARIAAAPRGP